MSVKEKLSVDGSIEKVGVYSIYDKVAKYYLPIFESRNDNVAIREFKNSIKQNPFANLSEYLLVRLGTVERDSSEVEDDGEGLITLRFGELKVIWQETPENGLQEASRAK